MSRREAAKEIKNIGKKEGQRMLIMEDSRVEEKEETKMKERKTRQNIIHR